MQASPLIPNLEQWPKKSVLLFVLFLVLILRSVPEPRECTTFPASRRWRRSFTILRLYCLLFWLTIILLVCGLIKASTSVEEQRCNWQAILYSCWNAEADTIMGDLDEQFSVWVPHHGEAAALRRYAQQVRSIVLHRLWDLAAARIRRLLVW